MSKLSRERKAREKQARWDSVLYNAAVHEDDADGEEHRRAAAHAHVMTHHALEMDDPDAHRAAAAAHQKVAEMHESAADEMDEDEEAEAGEDETPESGKAAKGKSKAC